ncbi:hypothetical protein PtA15_3A753 [Puccinia triticina]|uniref:Uncharacterized protein n=1 Tax=Puccinia triticina TaxID=208348 RepID=A0ABY7CG88_9BASI|nr:uncharacterized protein PtA15_3A753 [Puccinia triticina]WAQ83383.1 hypothetical protein PtA15_3A753 [Puccinia triticina]
MRRSLTIALTPFDLFDPGVEPALTLVAQHAPAPGSGASELREAPHTCRALCSPGTSDGQLRVPFKLNQRCRHSMALVSLPFTRDVERLLNISDSQFVNSMVWFAWITSNKMTGFH